MKQPDLIVLLLPRDWCASPVVEFPPAVFPQCHFIHADRERERERDGGVKIFVQGNSMTRQN